MFTFPTHPIKIRRTVNTSSVFTRVVLLNFLEEKAIYTSVLKFKNVAFSQRGIEIQGESNRKRFGDVMHVISCLRPLTRVRIARQESSRIF